MGFLRQRLEPLGIQPTFLGVGIEPSAEEIVAAAAAVGQAEQTILFVYDAHLLASNKQLLDAVQGSAKKLAIILLRDVYDAEFVKPNVLAVTGYGFRICEIDAALKKLLTPSAFPPLNFR